MVVDHRDVGGIASTAIVAVRAARFFLPLDVGPVLW